MFPIKQKIKYLILIILFGGTILIWSVVFNFADNEFLEVTFFDVGQGDSIFIETPNRKQVLIDGGPDKTILEKLNETIPFYDKTIDLIILTHPDTDHITGLVSVLEYYDVKYILTSGIENETVVYKEWHDLIEEKNIPLILAQSGQKIFLEQDIILEIIWPEQSSIESFSKPTNNTSIVGRLIYGDIEFLLTGDIEKKVENYLISQNLNLESDIFKAPHHGSKTSSNYNFIEIINPQASVISVGRDNRYKHPNDEVLERLRESIIYRTDKNGDIKILTDGILFDILTTYE
ncbi:MAG: ComEC/Rec2 family competence protein [Patescibacteria group bacterium]|nr:MBL fold metallo-hydrolase [Patescibacteria group bacterium]